MKIEIKLLIQLNNFNLIKTVFFFFFSQRNKKKININEYLFIYIYESIKYLFLKTTLKLNMHKQNQK